MLFANLGSMDKAPKVIFGVAGSIASYRAPDLVKTLRSKGYDIQCVLTSSGEKFVTAKTLETFSSKKVLSNDLWSEDHEGTDHIRYARWADLFLVYGVTANLMAKLAHGFADDFLTLQILATRAPVVLVPAMNVEMWRHPATQANVKVLEQRGVSFVGPISGTLACGEVGVGHVASLNEIEDFLEKLLFTPQTRSYFNSHRILLSLGSMRTDIDEVRFLQNKSSGRMGIEFAKSLKASGANVSILAGCVDSDVEDELKDFDTYRFNSFESYRQQLKRLWTANDCHSFFSLAAVLDFTIQKQKGKLERGLKTLSLSLEPTEDLVAWVAAHKKDQQKVIAFSLESAGSEFIKRAQGKLLKKKADLIIANRADKEGHGPSSPTNALTVIDSKAVVFEIECKVKSLAAKDCVEQLSRYFSSLQGSRVELSPPSI